MSALNHEGEDDVETYGENLYVGLSDFHMEMDHFDLGLGITLTKTYVHLMAPFILAFKPAKPGQPHPGPWSTSGGGVAFDIHTQLHIPNSTIPKWGFDDVNTAHWITGLLRMLVAPHICARIMSDEPFAAIPSLNHVASVWPLETRERIFRFSDDLPGKATEADLSWVKEHWLEGGRLNANKNFSTAFQAFDNATATTKMSLALISIWGGIEQLFSVGRQELRYRIATALASYLEPPGAGRLSLYRQIVKLYDARSKVAHGTEGDDSEAFIQTYLIMSRALAKMIVSRHVPTREELEQLVFGVVE